MNPFRVEQIDHVEMFVPSRREAAQWYEQVLGFEVLAEHEHWATHPGGPLMISSDAGNTKLALFRGPVPSRDPTGGFRRVAFRVGATAFLEFLQSLADLELVDPEGNPVTRDQVTDHKTAYSIYFSDPFEHKLEITTYEHEEVRRRLDGG